MKRVVLVMLFLLVAWPAISHSVTDEGDAYHVSHSWTYKSDTWSCDLKISKNLYAHYKGQRVHKSDGFAGFALSDYDRECLRDLVRSFRETGKEANYSDYDNVYNVVAFVQSLQYVSDMESTGQDEYVRYPVETLVDGIGDCEDTSILMAAILYEMGYGVVLLSLPNHLALGVKGDSSIKGAYYVYDNQRYYYLETTDKGWNLGEVPDKYQRTSATVIPLVYVPKVILRSYELHSGAYDRESVECKITCKVENEGPGSTLGMFLHVMAYRKGHSNRVLAERFIDLEDLSEGHRGEYEFNVIVPRVSDVVFELSCSGRNFESNALKSKPMDLE